MRVVASFPSRHVVRSVPYRTARLVSRTRVFERVAELLDRATVARDRRITPRGPSKSSLAKIERLVRELDGPEPAMRVLRAVEWYERHVDDKYVPWIEGGRTLYEKFGKLEVQMRHHAKDEAPGRTADEVVSGLFNGSRVLADAFRRDVVTKAKKLGMGQVSDADLAFKLGATYVAIRTARQGASSDGLPGPLDLLERYLDWLGERRDWRMTTRVLGIDSPAFQQFVREESSRHPRGVDPLTGRG